MKKLTILVAVVVIFGAAAYALAAGDSQASGSGIKVGYVDMNACLNGVREGKAAKAQLESDGKAKKQKLEIMQGELKKMKEDLDKQRLILSKDALQEKEAEFQKKFFELQKTSADFEREFAEKETNYIKPISEKLQRVIQQIGSQGGYTLIIPREMALYTGGTDLTTTVIGAYDSSK